jgi:hypothetical protein
MWDNDIATFRNTIQVKKLAINSFICMVQTLSLKQEDTNCRTKVEMVHEITQMNLL